MNRLRVRYHETIRPALATDLGIKNPMALPRVIKVVVNVGLNLARTDQKKIDKMTATVATITGQKPTVRRSRKAVSSFKIRAGEPVGLALTLRGQRMYDLLERVIQVALPRVRDFRGIARKSFDGHGNLTLGFRDLSVFPEIRHQDLEAAQGLEMTIVTSAETDEAGEQLLAALGMPFSKNA